MDFVNDPARASLVRQIRSEDTLFEVRAAQSALRRWRHQHPQDQGILDAGEELSLLEDALMEDDSPPASRLPGPSGSVWSIRSSARKPCRRSPSPAMPCVNG